MGANRVIRCIDTCHHAQSCLCITGLLRNSQKKRLTYLLLNFTGKVVSRAIFWGLQPSFPPTFLFLCILHARIVLQFQTDLIGVLYW